MSNGLVVVTFNYRLNHFGERPAAARTACGHAHAHVVQLSDSAVPWRGCRLPQPGQRPGAGQRRLQGHGGRVAVGQAERQALRR